MPGPHAVPASFRPDGTALCYRSVSSGAAHNCLSALRPRELKCRSPLSVVLHTGRGGCPDVHRKMNRIWESDARIFQKIRVLYSVSKPSNSRTSFRNGWGDGEWVPHDLGWITLFSFPVTRPFLTALLYAPDPAGNPLSVSGSLPFHRLELFCSLSMVV